MISKSAVMIVTIINKGISFFISFHPTLYSIFLVFESDRGSINTFEVNIVFIPLFYPLFG